MKVFTNQQLIQGDIKHFADEIHSQKPAPFETKEAVHGNTNGMKC